MSISSDFHAAKHKSSGLLLAVSEAHPVLVSLVFMGALVAVLVLGTGYLMR